jgi:hypothetical protein
MKRQTNRHAVASGVVSLLVGLALGFSSCYFHGYLRFLPISKSEKLSICTLQVPVASDAALPYLQTPSQSGSAERVGQLKFMRAHVTASSVVVEWLSEQKEVNSDLEEAVRGFQASAHRLVLALDAEGAVGDGDKRAGCGDAVHDSDDTSE